MPKKSVEIKLSCITSVKDKVTRLAKQSKEKIKKTTRQTRQKLKKTEEDDKVTRLAKQSKEKIKKTTRQTRLKKTEEDDNSCTPLGWSFFSAILTDIVEDLLKK